MKKVFILGLLLASMCSFSFWPFHEKEKEIPKKKILLGSPVHQKPAILAEFLTSLRELEPENYILDYYLIDDNDSEESSKLLQAFSAEQKSLCLVEKSQKGANDPQYICDDVTHHWKDAIVWKVAAFKDRMIEYAEKNGYDYLFLIDSDIVLHPKTIDQLIKSEKDIVSNIFWTRWTPDSIEQPQVWLSDFYTQYETAPGENLSGVQAHARTLAFYDKLRKPGVYEVGGLGACTLISRKALEKGISFEKIKNLTFWGEDRHFCVRAAALGLQLFVDTHLPAYHIYREANLAGVAAFKQSTKVADQIVENASKPPRITLSMVMRNEGDRYLRRVLESAREYISDAVIIDDASTDNSVEVCEEVLQGIPLRLIKNQESRFANEYQLRKQQWDETIKVNPEWILVLDADEIFESRFKDEVKELVANPDIDAYYFRLYDLWDEEHYRADSYWQAHQHFRPFLFRYKPEITYVWRETPQHCGRHPLTIMEFPYVCSDLRLKHYGWAQAADRQAKYERYQQLDPGAKYGWQAQYDSILDPAPNLIVWKE